MFEKAYTAIYEGMSDFWDMISGDYTDEYVTLVSI